VGSDRSRLVCIFRAEWKLDGGGGVKWGEGGRTILERPRAVTIHRACMSPYKRRAWTSSELRSSSWMSSSGVICQ